MNFNLQSAQDYARQGKLEDWILAYLSTGHWQNTGLSDGLKLAQRRWTAPVYVPLESLVRCCEPEAGMEYRVSQENWDKRVNYYAENLKHVDDLPPLIINHRDGIFSIRDGSHRHEAMRRKGWTHCWVVIWYNTEAEWKQSPYYEHRVSNDGSN